MQLEITHLARFGENASQNHTWKFDVSDEGSRRPPKRLISSVTLAIFTETCKGKYQLLDTLMDRFAHMLHMVTISGVRKEMDDNCTGRTECIQLPTGQEQLNCLAHFAL